MWVFLTAPSRSLLHNYESVASFQCQRRSAQGCFVANPRAQSLCEPFYQNFEALKAKRLAVPQKFKFAGKNS
jgi:hypothetical protein